MTQYKKSDLVFIDRPDCDWVAKIADVDLKTNKFTIANAIIKFKSPEQDEEDIEEQDHEEDVEEQDDRIDLLDSPDVEDPAEFVNDWQALVSTLSPEQMPSVVHQFPLDFITRHADAYEFDKYIDLIVDFKDNTFGEVIVQKKSKRGLMALDN